MGVLTNNQRLVLYSLGQCYSQLNRKFEDKPLEISVSKIAFIEALLKSGLVSKKARALYKNLETLEKKKLIVYDNKMLKFTKRGYSSFSRLGKEIEPYVTHNSFWNSDVKFNRKLQARLKG